MTNLADLLPAGGGQNNTDFVADGNVSAGAPVILTAAGKAAPIVGSSDSVGSSAIFGGDPYYPAVTYDTANDKIVVAYRDEGDSGYAKMVVGTVSGTSITWGTPVSLGVVANFTAVTYDVNSGKVVVALVNVNTNEGLAASCTVSGTSISAGTLATFNNANTEDINIDYDSNAQKCVISYSDQGNSSYGTAIVATVSGTSVSFGSEAVFSSGTVQPLGAAFDSTSNKMIFAYRKNSVGTACVGTVSGTSISFGSEVVFESGEAYNISVAHDVSQNKNLIAYEDINNSAYGTAIVGTVSGTSISFGTAVVFESAEIDQTNAVYDSNNNATVIGYADQGNSYYGTVVSATISGTTVSFTSPYVWLSGRPGFLGAGYDPDTNQVIFAYRDNNNSNQGTGICFTPGATNLTSTNLLGLASGAISDTATGTINTWGSRNEAAFPVLATGSTTDLTGKTQSPYPDITYDITQGKFVVFFEDGNNSNYGTAVVATVSGSTVSFGTPVVFNSGTTIALGATYSEANGRHVVVYPNYSDSQKATAAVGTVSGTSISFGTPVVFDSTITNTQCSVAYNSTLGKYLAGAMTSTIKVTVLTVDPSDNSVTFGTPVSLTGTRYYPNIVSNESASDFVLTNAINDNQAEAHLISVSGTTPTVEDTETISSVVSTSYPRTGLVFLESNKFVCVTSENNTNSMYTRTITVSGTSLSIGTQSAAFTVDPDNQTAINGRWPLFFVSTTEAYLYYADDTSDYLKYVPITISGTTATSGTELTYHSTLVSYAGFGYNSSTKQSLSFFQDGSQTKGLAQNGALVIGTDYYVQTDGSLSTDTGGQLIGNAITTTQINIKDYTG